MDDDLGLLAYSRTHLHLPQVRSWATILAMLVALYFLLTNPGLVVMIFVGYRLLKG